MQTKTSVREPSAADYGIDQKANHHEDDRGTAAGRDVQACILREEFSAAEHCAPGNVRLELWKGVTLAEQGAKVKRVRPSWRIPP